MNNIAARHSTPVLGHALRALTLERLLAALLFLAVAAAATTAGFDVDTWWHLRAGQLIWQSGRVWTIDPLSSTGLGNPWPNHEWLSQALFYACYRLGGAAALVALGAAVIITTWDSIRRLCTGPATLWGPLLALGVLSHSIVWSLRPHLFTLLGLPLLLLLLRSGRPGPAFPALLLVWANLHGGVAFGGAALALGAAAIVWYDRGAWRRWAAVVAAGALATLATPLGVGLWGFTVGMIAHPQTTYIREWLPPSLGWPVSYPFFALAALWVAALALRHRELARRLAAPDGAWVLTLLVLGLAFLAMGMRAIRHTPLFAIVAIPMLCELAPLRLRAFEPSSVSVPRGLGHAAALLLACVTLVAALAFGWRAAPADAPPISPEAVAAVRACEGALFNTYTLGGAVLWLIPERPVFVDSRNDPYPLDLLFSAVLTEQNGEYAGLFARYDVRCVIAEDGSPLVAALEADPGWALTHRDARVVTFAKR